MKHFRENSKRARRFARFKLRRQRRADFARLDADWDAAWQDLAATFWPWWHKTHTSIPSTDA